MKELKELAVAVCKVVNAADRIVADGKVGLSDLPHLMPVAIALPAAFGGIQAIPTEFKNMGPAEAEELKNCIAAELDLKSDITEAMVEEIVGVALQLASAILMVRGAKAAVQPEPAPAA